MGSVIPTLSFRAIDKNDQVLPHVKVSTVFGSDRGTLVASQGDGYDILRFSGPGQHDVADVEVTGAAAAAVARNSRGPAVSIKAHPSQ